MARASQTQRNYAIEQAKKTIVAAIAAVQVADRNERIKTEKDYNPTFGDLQNALRNGKITLPAGTDLTQLAHTNYNSVKNPIQLWINDNSKKCKSETETSYYNSIPRGFVTTSSSWSDVEAGRYLSSHESWYFKQANLDKVKKLLAAFEYTQRAIMLGDAAEMSIALTELAERISSI